MKLTCGIVEDLLPLYGDDVCGEESKQAVRSHIEKCSRCRELAEKTKVISVPIIEPEQPEADKAVKKGLRKIRIRWWGTIVACFVIMSIVLMFWNPFYGNNVNVFDQAAQKELAQDFMSALTDGDYEKAYSYWNVEYTRLLWTMDWFVEEELTNLEADGRAKFCELGQAVEANGGIESFEYIDISPGYAVGYDGVKSSCVRFTMCYAGKEYIVSVSVSVNGVDGFSAGKEITHPLERLGRWSEWLWQDYRGCYWDPETKTYVYYEAE